MIRLALVCALALCGCGGNKEKEARRKDLIALMHGNTGDADIKAAMEKGRATVDEFLAALKKPAANQKQFMVRKVFPTKVAGTQQILWVTEVTFDGKLLHGRVNDNTSQPGSGIAPDGRVSFPATEIVDWMFNEDGKAVGGFMLRALKAKMTPEEWNGIASKLEFKD